MRGFSVLTVLQKFVQAKSNTSLPDFIMSFRHCSEIHIIGYLLAGGVLEALDRIVAKILLCHRKDEEYFSLNSFRRQAVGHYPNSSRFD